MGRCGWVTWAFLSLCVPVAGDPSCNVLGWSHLQVVEDSMRGQNHYHFGHSVAANGQWLAVGSTDANMAKGHVRLYYDDGSGYYEHTRLVDACGSIMDNFGAALVWNPQGTELLIGAPGKAGRGAAFSATASGMGPTRNFSAPRLLVPATPLAQNAVWQWGVHSFGRAVGLGGTVAAVASQLWQPGLTSTNIRGSKLFIETWPPEDLTDIPNNYVTIFQRDSNGVWQEAALVTAAVRAPEFDFGSSLALVGPFLAVGASPTPPARNTSAGTASGWVHIFHTNGSAWSEWQQLRPADALFIGHSVALSPDAEWLAFGSEWWDRPATHGAAVDAVYVYHRDATGVFQPTVQLPAPANTSHFGRSLAFGNGTLVVGAPGGSLPGTNDTVQGVAVVYQLQGGQWTLVEVLADPLLEGASDSNFGAAVTAVGDQLFVLSNASAPEEMAANPYLSQGAAHVWRLLESDLDAATANVSCRNPTFTANVSNACVIRLWDTTGQPQGEWCHTEFFAVSVPGMQVDPSTLGVRFVTRGTFAFDLFTGVECSGATVAASYKGIPLGPQPLTVKVVPAIAAHNSTFRCNATVPAGFEVICLLHAFAFNGQPTGAPDAAAGFTVAVSNLGDPTKGPVLPSVTEWLSTGLFQFTFIPSSAGAHAVLVRYGGALLAVPNRAVVDVTVPALFPSHTTVDCPVVVAPGRNATCRVTIRGAHAAALGGDPTVLSHLNATLWNAGILLPVLEWRWEQVGVVRFLFQPQNEGALRVNASFDGVGLSNTFVGPLLVAQTVKKCALLPLAAKTVDLLVATFLYTNNDTLYQNDVSHTDVTQNVRVVCEEVDV